MLFRSARHSRVNEDAAFRRIIAARPDFSALGGEALSTARRLARRIEAGHVIAVGPPGGGFWTPTSDNEIAELLAGQNPRAVELVGLLRATASKDLPHSAAYWLVALLILALLGLPLLPDLAGSKPSHPALASERVN